MTSPNSAAVKLVSLVFWQHCSCWLWLWSVPSLRSSEVQAANSLSVLDSKLLPLYQKYQQTNYDVYEPGFAVDPVGYEARNALQRHHPAGKTAKDTLKVGPGTYLVDGGYHTRTIPLYQNHHDTGGYATQNAFQPHYSAGQVDGGYHTRTVGFPMYQDYQHEPSGYATRNAFHPYRSGIEHTKDAAAADSGKYLTDGGYQTKTVASTWFPLYQDYQHNAGYATQNAIQPYRSGVEVGSSHVGRTAESGYTEDNEAVDEDRVVSKQFYSDDDDDEQLHADKYIDDDDGLTGDWSTQRATTAPATDDYYNSNSFVHEPT